MLTYDSRVENENRPSLAEIFYFLNSYLLEDNDDDKETWECLRKLIQHLTNKTHLFEEKEKEEDKDKNNEFKKFYLVLSDKSLLTLSEPREGPSAESKVFFGCTPYREMEWH